LNRVELIWDVAVELVWCGSSGLDCWEQL